MKKLSIIVLLMLLAASIGSFSALGQSREDSSKVFKNTIRLNITNPMIFGERNVLLGYERVVGEHQSFSVNTGLFSLPRFTSFNADSIALLDGSESFGYSLAADYRFYLKKENKFNAPRGIYIGPYYAYNYFERKNSWTLNTSDFEGGIDTRLRLNAHLIGGELGYQFVIRERFSIDLILFGPGVWFYKVKTNLSTDLSEEDEAMLIEKLNEILAEKLPGNEILIKPGENISKKSVTTSSLGLRYVINIGFRF